MIIFSICGWSWQYVRFRPEIGNPKIDRILGKRGKTI